MSDNKAGDGGAANDLHDAAARLKAHVEALQRSVQTLRGALEEVDSAVAISRARLFAAQRQQSGGAERRSGLDRRSPDGAGFAAACRSDGVAADRRAGTDRRAPAAGAPAASVRAPAVAAPNVVSLADYREQRARLRESR